MDERFLPYVITEVFCIANAVIICLRLKKSTDLEYESRCLQHIILAYIIMVATDALSAFLEHSAFARLRRLNALSSGVSLAAVVLGCLFWLDFVETRLSGAKRPRWAVYLFRGLAAVLCGLDLVSIFTGWVFFISGTGCYTLGRQFWVQDVGTTFFLLVPTEHALYKAFFAASADKRKEYLSYVGYIALGFAAVLVGDSLPTVPLMALAVLLAVQMLFMTLYLDGEYKLARQERELSDSRMAVLLSQIQPHFLYNTLTVIQEMCGDRAPEAAETTVEFAEFLRGNLGSLTRREPIAFEQELHHTQIYLSLEQKRFGARLKVEYDIQAAAFQLPALTLQPIAENAVQHGISEKKDGGTVRIASRETADAWEVEVKDDGVGCDPGAGAGVSGGRAQIGIANVRERLKALCGGTLSVHSEPGKGTEVVLSIPKRGGGGNPKT